MFKPVGSLYSYDTPNRAWPIDFHTTGLLGIPWTKPCSPSAYARAVRAGRYGDSPRYTPGPRGMGQCGAWGATYWETRSAIIWERFDEEVERITNEAETTGCSQRGDVRSCARRRYIDAESDALQVTNDRI